jgi:hypothetical protein
MRGACYAWGGPVILAVIWAILKANGKIDTLTVNEVVMGIISTTVMAFIAAGISFVYEIESLPKSFAALIQGAVLYIDYMGIYLLNGWLPVNQIMTFTLIFAIGFIVIWLCIYISTKHKVDKMNDTLNH